MVNKKDIGAFINDSRKFLGLELEEACRAMGNNAQSVCADAYGSMENLISLENPQSFPGTLYLEQQRVVLVRLSEEGLRGYSKESLSSLLGETPVRLRSPGGKQANLMVNAHEGIACSCLGDLLQFIELFEPCSQKSYENRIYKKPLPFIR
ncbi:MAG: hypothetical protein ACOC7X_08850 [Spirochaetota bacterium]